MMDVNNIFIDRDKNLESFLEIYPKKLRRGFLRRWIKKGIGGYSQPLRVLNREKHDIISVIDDFNGQVNPDTMTIFYLFPFLKKAGTHIIKDAVRAYADKRIKTISIKNGYKEVKSVFDYSVIGSSIAIEMKIEVA